MNSPSFTTLLQCEKLPLMMCYQKCLTSHLLSCNYKFVTFKCFLSERIGIVEVHSCLFLEKILLKPVCIDDF